MHLAYTAEQLAFQQQVRSLLAELMTPELTDEVATREGGGPLYLEAMRRLGREGWLGVGWPKDVGGQGRGFLEEYLFFDEMHRAGFPIPLLTLNTVGPTLLAFGTPEQKATYVPRILAGTCHFSIGYSEPSAGTDLASLTTAAVRDGDHYVVTGQKIWISLADHADYLWLACRTDPDAPRHKGISILIVPMDAPGVSTTRIRNLGDSNIHAVYLDAVRVPVANLVGREHGGWRLITTQLNHERIALMMVGPLARLSEAVRHHAAATPDDRGGVLLDRPWVRRSLAEVEAGLEVLRLLNWKQAWTMEHGDVAMQDASGLKVFGSEFYVRAYRLLLEIMGQQGMVRRGSPGARLHGDLERHYRATLVLTFGGGVNEVQRDIIAMAGLGLPRAER
ncbi:MAG: acyl-CoA dehydrogenase family protein [Alphaproteobacteria bacterium]|nr:acyl-CoA dehydrogenase family protein [Alphaproteobacteria bacterium]